MAADVVAIRDSSARTLAQLKVLRKKVFDPRTAEHNGRIIKTMGDGLLVEFASAVGTTQCAVKIQSALTRRNEEVPLDHRVGPLRVSFDQPGGLHVENPDFEVLPPSHLCSNF
jgi:class 3 adenylate cyclase